MEILNAHPEPIEAIFCCVGGGGLLAGIAAYVKAVRPEIKVIGVEAKDAEAMTESLKQGERVMLRPSGFICRWRRRKAGGRTYFCALSAVCG